MSMYIFYSFGLILRFDIWRATELKMIECFGRLCTSFPHLVVNWSLQNTFIATNILHHKFQIQKQVFAGPLWNYKLTTCFCYSVFLIGHVIAGPLCQRFQTLQKQKNLDMFGEFLQDFPIKIKLYIIMTLNFPAISFDGCLEVPSVIVGFTEKIIRLIFE